MGKYHINEDGTVPCTNCGVRIEQSFMSEVGWIHPRNKGPLIHCWEDGLEVACPEPPNDDPNEWTQPMKEKWG